MRRGAPALVVALAAPPLLSCGSSELGELPACQTEDCMLPARTVIAWGLDRAPERLFTGDTCQDLGAVTMHAELTGIEDPTQFAAKDVGCSQGQVTLLGLAPGHYAVALTPLDGDGEPMVRAPITAEVAAGATGSDTSITVEVPWDAWLGSYGGTFLFRLAWAGGSCDQGVETQTLTLVAGGSVVHARTDSRQKLDGTDARPCRPLDEPYAQYAPEDPEHDPGLPFGPATFTVVGRTADGTVAYEHSFETFVGAGKNNPTITFDVPAVEVGGGGDAGVDAGVDAPVDAATDAM